MIAVIKQFLVGCWLLLTVAHARAEIELPAFFSQGAVLQRDEPIPIWGKAPAGSLLNIEFAEARQEVRADEEGHWQTTFPARKAGGPYRIHISTQGFSKTLENIWLGDLWLCTGQSNMEWPLSKSEGVEAEMEAAPFPKIRQFKIPRSWSIAPSDSLAGGDWQTATRENLGSFTGVGWYFAKRIHAATGVPIGLINATWGGSKIEAWMSPSALGKTSEYTIEILQKRVTEGELRVQSLQKTLQRWPGSVVSQLAVATADWSAPHMDESDWLDIQVPGLWETQAYPGVDGVIWYRRHFELTASQAAAGIRLGLGRIDDNDITWVNGHKVGETQAYDRVRTYAVPATFLNEGKNQIAIRIEDFEGGGGIYSDAELVYWQTAGGERNSLAGQWKIKADRVTLSLLDNVQHAETALYNQMLFPLFKLPIKGVVWYQGESNADTLVQAQNYRQQFPTLIRDWRERFHKPDLPFYWVQLANFNSKSDTPEASPWAQLRESQTAALALNNTGQAVIIDSGNPEDIHPTDKKTVGERLARIALNKTYGQNNTHYRGPFFQSAKIEHSQVLVKFSTPQTLTTRFKGAPVMGFEIAGADGQFQKVNGSLKSNRVELPLDKIAHPKTLRYAWGDNPVEANLTDTEGLPAEPFRGAIEERD